MRRGIAVVVAATALLAGCGDDGDDDEKTTDNGGSSSEEAAPAGASEDPAGTVAAYLDAMAEGDTAAMCDLSGTVSEAYTGPVDEANWTQSECEAEVSTEVDGIGDAALAEVEAEGDPEMVEQTHGMEARFGPEQLTGLENTSLAQSNYGLRLMQFDGRWYVTDAF